MAEFSNIVHACRENSFLCTALLQSRIFQNGNKLIITCVSAQVAERIWFNVQEFAASVAANNQSVIWLQIRVEGHVQNFVEVQIRTLLRPERSANIEESLTPLQERALIAAAMTTKHSAAIVSMRTNRVLATNSNVGKWDFSSPVDWVNFYMVPLWQPPGSTEVIQEVNFLKHPECMPPELQKLYKYLLRDKLIEGIEYTAHTGIKKGATLQPGSWSNFIADAFLIEEFYGEPARLVMIKAQQKL